MHVAALIVPVDGVDPSPQSTVQTSDVTSLDAGSPTVAPSSTSSPTGVGALGALIGPNTGDALVTLRTALSALSGLTPSSAVSVTIHRPSSLHSMVVATALGSVMKQVEPGSPTRNGAKVQVVAVSGSWLATAPSSGMSAPSTPLTSSTVTTGPGLADAQEMTLSVEVDGALRCRASSLPAPSSRLARTVPVWLMPVTARS